MMDWVENLICLNGEKSEIVSGVKKNAFLEEFCIRLPVQWFDLSS